MHLVSAEHEQQKRNGDCLLHIQTVTFPYTLLWLPLTSSLSSSVLSLFCCLWIGERTTPNLLFLRVVANPLNLRANEIVAGKLYHLIILCPSQVQLTAFLEVRNGAQMKRNMFFIFIFKHHYPPHPPIIQNLHTSSGKGEVITKRTLIFSGEFFNLFLTLCYFGCTYFF